MNLPVLHELQEKAQKLLQIPNFNPVDYISSYTNSDGNKSYYLEVKYRILWFRYCYPLGRIKVDISHHDSKSVTVIATIYLDMTLADDQFISQAIAHKYNQPDSDYDFVEWAQTKAIGRALAYVGFGQQFCGILEKPEPEQVDSPVVILQPHTQPNQNQQTSTVVQMQQSQQVQQPSVDQQMQQTVHQTPSQSIKNTSEDYDPLQDSSYFDQVGFPNEPVQVSNNTNSISQSPTNSITVTSKPKPTNFKEALQMLTPQDCMSINIDINGPFKNQTLGDLYTANNTKSLDWFANTYGGNKFMVKAGATILLAAKQQQAS